MLSAVGVIFGVLQKEMKSKDYLSRRRSIGTFFDWKACFLFYSRLFEKKTRGVKNLNSFQPIK